MKSSPLSLSVFRRTLDVIPAEVTLWKSGKNPKRWQDYTTLYCNEETARVTGRALIENLGAPAGQLFSGLEKSNLIETFIHSVVTRQIQECVYRFGNDRIQEKDRRATFFPLPQGCFGTVSLDVTDQIKAEKAKAEEILQLEELNKQLVERELQMIQLKSEIAELEEKGKY